MVQVVILNELIALLNQHQVGHPKTVLNCPNEGLSSEKFEEQKQRNREV
jgi:hypothetical protein